MSLFYKIIQQRRRLENKLKFGANKGKYIQSCEKTVDSMGYSPHDKITNTFAHQIFIYV